MIYAFRIRPHSSTISLGWCFGDTSDIPALANVAIGKINQTNPGVVRGIDSVPYVESSLWQKGIGINRSKVSIQGIADLLRRRRIRGAIGS